MALIAALDLGTAFGWAIADSDAPFPPCGTVVLPQFAAGWGAQLASFNDWLGRQIKYQRPDEIVYEEIMPTNAMMTTNEGAQRTLLGLAAHVHLLAYRFEIPVVPIYASTARSIMLKGIKRAKGADLKALVSAEVMRRGCRPDSGNASDAAALWFCRAEQIRAMGRLRA